MRRRGMTPALHPTHHLFSSSVESVWHDKNVGKHQLTDQSKMKYKYCHQFHQTTYQNVKCVGATRETQIRTSICPQLSQYSDDVFGTGATEDALVPLFAALSILEKVSYRKWYSSDKCLECRQYAQAGNGSRSTSDSSSIFFISGIHLTW